MSDACCPDNDPASGPVRTPTLGRRGLLTGLGAAGLTGLAAAGAPLPAASAGGRPHRILVFTRTTGFRHASIELGVQTVRDLGAEHGFAVRHTEDPTVFRARHLRRFTAVLFLNTTGNVLGSPARAALRDFVLDGGGWAGVHAAADSEYSWPFYTRLLSGGRFLCHPVQQPGVLVRQSDHRSVRHLPRRWTVPFEEFYSFTANPRERGAWVHLRIDESSYQQDPNTSHLPREDGSFGEPVSGVMGDHPMSWQRRIGDGLSWYTALGHEHGVYVNPDYRQHLLGGLLTVTRHGRRHLPS